MVICVAIVPVWLTNKILDPKLGSDFSPFNWKGILALTVGSTLGFVVPKPKTKGDYTLVIKLLHRLILDNYNLHIKLHKREVKRHHLKSKTSREDFIIITGLARAGTTSLLNKLANKKNIKSLHYGNMPFLLAPNLWKRFYNPTPGELKERSHKDGIMVNNVSYEALEEYFFKAISNDSYILETDINEYELSSEDCQAYLDYQMLLRADSADRYLAKNNNFLIRYDAIRKYNSEFSRG